MLSICWLMVPSDTINRRPTIKTIMRDKLFFLLMTLLLVLPLTGYAQQMVRGDVNGSGVVDIDDINAVINTMLHKADPIAGTDVDGNGAVDIDDLNIVINVIVGKDDNGSHGQGDWVDLGLPSGTLWASRNIGAASPEDYGDHFAWGEITPKLEYSWETYKWFNEYYDTEGNFHYGLTKYCTHFTGGLDDFVDNKIELDMDDDAAAANWGGGARMPSLDQIEELLNTCSWQFAQRNDVNGQLVTGPNGNSIFLPAAGIFKDAALRDNGYYGAYWSHALYSVSQGGVGSLFFDWGSSYLDSNYARCYGLTIRAVRVP